MKILVINKTSLHNMSIKKASRTTTTRTDRETSLSIEEMKENISSIREIINDRVLNNNLLTDTHFSQIKTSMN